MKGEEAMEARNMQLTEAGARSIRDDSYTGQLVEKWDRFLKGVSEDYTKKCMAMLMENQFLDMRRQLAEDTLSTNAGVYTKYIFPVLRRVFPNLIANEIVSVQPMTAPVGAVFFFEYKHGRSKGQTTAGTNLIQNFDDQYSSEKIEDEQLATITAAQEWSSVGGSGSAILQYNPVRPLDATVGYSVTVEEYNTTTAAVVQSHADDGAGGFTGATSGAINYATGQVTNFQFGVATTNGNIVRCTYWYDMEGNRNIPDVYIDISFETIRAQTRKLKARWSSEAADDLRAFHGVDAETELVSGISQEVALEIDRDILGQLFTASAGITQTFDFTVPAGITEIDHIRAIMTRMSAVSYQIHKQTLRAPANWYVTSPEISAKLVQLQTHGDQRAAWVSQTGNTQGPFDGIAVPPSYGPMTSHQGILKMGALSNKWMGYQDPFFQWNQLMLGLRGRSYLDAGFVFSPYVPLQMTPTFLDPEDQSYRKGMRTRYATKRLRDEWFGRVTVTGGL
jgi:hypothetical protein